MKIIFLDIDGVLNSNHTIDTIHGLIGIDDEKVKLLKKIIDATKAKIVLTSTWKHDWKVNEYGSYLDGKLAKENLFIIDKTPLDYGQRGKGIDKWLNKNKDKGIESWIAIDDDIFYDYEYYKILPRLVKTSFYDGGLKEEHIDVAISMLNKI